MTIERIYNTPVFDPPKSESERPGRAVDQPDVIRHADKRDAGRSHQLLKDNIAELQFIAVLACVLVCSAIAGAASAILL